jgi:hypothetical protein
MQIYVFLLKSQKKVLSLRSNKGPSETYFFLIEPSGLIFVFSFAITLL